MSSAIDLISTLADRARGIFATPPALRQGPSALHAWLSAMPTSEVLDTFNDVRGDLARVADAMAGERTLAVQDSGSAQAIRDREARIGPTFRALSSKYGADGGSLLITIERKLDTIARTLAERHEATPPKALLKARRELEALLDARHQADEALRLARRRHASTLTPEAAAGLHEAATRAEAAAHAVDAALIALWQTYGVRA